MAGTGRKPNFSVKRRGELWKHGARKKPITLSIEQRSNDLLKHIKKLPPNVQQQIQTHITEAKKWHESAERFTKTLKKDIYKTSPDENEKLKADIRNMGSKANEQIAAAERLVKSTRERMRA